MTISSQALSGQEQLRLENLLNTASSRRLRQLESLMAKSIREAISDPGLTAANVNGKIAARLKVNIPEITQP